MSLIISVFTLLLFMAEGIGFTIQFSPSVSRIGLMIKAMAVGFGINFLVINNCYFFFRSFSMLELVIPINLILLLLNGVIFLRYKQRNICEPSLPVEIWGLILSIFGFLLITSPLNSHWSEGYYFSNNGEFVNYAALADFEKFHSAARDVVGPFSTHSREGAASLIVSEISSILHIPSLYVVEAVAGSLALLFFAILTQSFKLANRRNLCKRKQTILILILICFILNSSSQLFWSLSFLSQYICLVLLLTLIITLHLGFIENIGIQKGGGLIGAFVAGLLISYPEMFFLNLIFAATLNFKFLIRLGWKKAMIGLAFASTSFTIVGFQFFTFIRARGLVKNGGWDIYGHLRPFNTFIGNLVGLSNPFSGPMTPIFFVVPVVLGVVFYITFDALRNSTEIAFTYAVGLLVFICGFFILNQYRKLNEIQTNYLVLKFLLEFEFIPVILIILWAVTSKKRLTSKTLGIFLILILVAQIGPARTFYSYQQENARLAFYSHEQAKSLVRSLDLNNFPYIPKNYMAIPSNFLLHEENIFESSNIWPGFEVSSYKKGMAIIILGDSLKNQPDKDITSVLSTRKTIGNIVLAR